MSYGKEKEHSVHQYSVVAPALLFMQFNADLCQEFFFSMGFIVSPSMPVQHGLYLWHIRVDFCATCSLNVTLSS